MKLAVHAKLGKEAKGAEGGARAEPASRRQRALRPVESGDAAHAERNAEPAGETYRLERTPIEAPASPLRLVVAGRASFGRDEDAAAHTERPPAPARGLIEGDPAKALSERRRSGPGREREPRTRRASERAAAKPEPDEPRARKRGDAALAPKPPDARRADRAKRKGEEATDAARTAPAPPLPAPVVAPALPAASAAAAGAMLSGTPAQIQQNLTALPPSAQADVYGGLGSALDAALAVAGTQAESAVPPLSASLEGAAQRPAAPTLLAPAAPAVAAPALDSSAPTPYVPRAPEPVPVTAPALPAQYPGIKPGEAAPDPAAIGDVLVALAARPEIVTAIEAPEIPLEAAADPAQLDTLESGASSEAGSLLAQAQAGVSATPADVVAPLALQETVAPPPLPELESLGSTPEVEGMAELASYELGPTDRAAFDAQMAPTMQAAAAGAGGELDANEAAFDAHQASLLAEADAASVSARSEAEAKQQGEVDAAQQDLSVEQQSVLDQQRAATDGALADLSSENERRAQQIDDRIETDRAAIDSTYARAENDAQAEVDAGATRSESSRSEAGAESESDSWWDWGIDAWQSFVQAVADQVVSIWEGVTKAVAGVFDAAIGLATKIVNGAVSFVKEALTKYFDFWKGLITDLVGSVFPELAAKLTAWIDTLQATVFAALDTIAAAYLGLLRWVADGIVAGLSAGLAAYKAGVAAYLAVWEAIQQGEWADLGTMLITALLVTVGISPEEFFATFTQIDEIIAAVAEDPTLVIVNAINALSLGFELFGTHFLDHFMAAAVEWITGAVSIEMPDTFDLAGLFDVVCQVLGLTYDHLREKAVQHVGEGAVTVVEELLAAMWAFVEGGWSGLWTYVKDGLTSLVDDVVMTLGSWLVEKAIFVVTRWVAGLAATMGFSAIIEGLIALWQFTMWLKDQFQRFWQIIKATVDSVHEFVMGNIQPAAETIEATLENLIPPAIDLIAKLLGIGNIPDKVGEVVESVRKVVDDAIDKVFVSLMQAAGFGGKKKAGEEEEEAEGENDPVYGALFRKRAITLEGEEHHLYVKGEPGGFDLVIASAEGPAEVNSAVQANPEALQATVQTNDELTALNVLAADPQPTDVEQGQLKQEAKQADEAVVQLANTLGGPDDSRDGPITLAMLNDPPVTLPRTDDEELTDLGDAEKVLGLAANTVEDTAKLAQYFERIQQRFQLARIGYERLGEGTYGVELNINPTKTPKLPSDLKISDMPDSNGDRFPIGNTVDPNPDYAPAKVLDPFGPDKVGTSMIANPLGPEHPAGAETSETVQPNLMKNFDKAYKYRKGHLLNADLGGPNSPENLFPITASANSLHEARIESYVKERVNDDRWFVYYEVKIDPVVVGPAPDAWVDCTIQAWVGILTVDNGYTDTVHVTIPSKHGERSVLPEEESIDHVMKKKAPASVDVAKRSDVMPKRVGGTKSKNAAIGAEKNAKYAEALVDVAQSLQTLPKVGSFSPANLDDSQVKAFATAARSSADLAWLEAENEDQAAAASDIDAATSAIERAELARDAAELAMKNAKKELSQLIEGLASGLEKADPDFADWLRSAEAIGMSWSGAEQRRDDQRTTPSGFGSTIQDVIDDEDGQVLWDSIDDRAIEIRGATSEAKRLRELSFEAVDKANVAFKVALDGSRLADLVALEEALKDEWANLPAGAHHIDELKLPDALVGLSKAVKKLQEQLGARRAELTSDQKMAIKGFMDWRV